MVSERISTVYMRVEEIHSSFYITRRGFSLLNSNLSLIALLNLSFMFSKRTAVEFWKLIILACLKHGFLKTYWE